MVHALEETRRLLKLDGVLVNMLPIPEGYIIEVHHDGRILFAERKRETLSEDVLAREEYLYAQAEQILDELGEGAEVVIYERVRIARLNPVK